MVPAAPEPGPFLHRSATTRLLGESFGEKHVTISLHNKETLRTTQSFVKITFNAFSLAAFWNVS